MTILISKDGRLAKRHLWRDGDWHTESYDNAYKFDAIDYSPTSIGDIHDLLLELEGNPYAAIVRGDLIDPSVTTDLRRTMWPGDDHPPFFRAPDGLSWLMLDLDKIEAPEGMHPDDRIEFLIKQLPPVFHAVDCVFQWSASAGVKPWDTLSAHIWFMLNEDWFCRDLRSRFSEGGDWHPSPVDLRLFSPVQLHYTASPLFDGAADPVPERMVFLKRGLATVDPGVWVKPIEPPHSPLTSVHYDDPNNRFAKFERLLDRIGPVHYHEPICEAVAHFVGKFGYDHRDVLMEGLRSRTNSSGRSYINNSYFNNVIRSAERKFAGKSVR